MKRHGHLFEKITDIDNIRHAIWKSSEGKRNQKRVREILDNDLHYAYKIQQMLVDKTYSPYRSEEKKIFDNSNLKERVINKPAYYPDQIVQWALMLVLEPVMMRGMYHYNCGSIPGRGASFGQKAVRKWMKKDRKNTKYCLKMDIKKFYPSVKGHILKREIRRKVKDNDCLWLIDTIIDQEEGLPIGFYTSQWFSNFVLERLDHFIKQTLGVTYYVRYVDDLVLFGRNKRQLHRMRQAVMSFLGDFELTIKDNWQVFHTKHRPVDFLGFRFYTTHTTLRRRNALRIRRRVQKIRKKGRLTFRDACAVISYWGWVRKSNSYRFYQKYIRPFVTIKQCKRKVSDHARAKVWGAAGRQTQICTA